MFALNTSFDDAMLDTPFYLVHGWDAQGTISAMLGPKPSTVQERTALEWRRKMQRNYSYALASAEDLQKEGEALVERSDCVKAGFEAGDSVWLYIPKVRTGLTHKLAHLWHGPFQIDEIHDDFRVKLKIPGTGYRVNPSRFATMVRGPGSSGDSGFHRESQEDVKVKEEHRGRSAYECWIDEGIAKYGKIHRSAEYGGYFY
ncbi:hypothetical protein PHMEG_0009038 [Phytophthora megakarya]|uniref:Reverse transcriptase n=1 Tax=Phytophthora megakarya TaxID=4795 RepID=A0A225WIJ4_9STRA|nr:hypothetical protein PHMEG_0009038 [Phytophthora megakarya]